MHFQKSQKIYFCTRKKSKNCIFGSFKLFSGAKIDFFFSIFENANNAFLHFWNCTFFSNFRALWAAIVLTISNTFNKEYQMYRSQSVILLHNISYFIRNAQPVIEIEWPNVYWLHTLFFVQFCSLMLATGNGNTTRV